MSDRLTVAALPSTMEAELIRGKLTAAGIEAVLVEPAADDEPQRGVAGRVQVQVDAADFERAMQLLFPIPTFSRTVRAEPPPSWKCAHCGEEVIGDSQVCWSCGANRDGAPTSHPSVAVRAVMPSPLPAATFMAPPTESGPAATPAMPSSPETPTGANHRSFKPSPPGDGVPVVLPSPVPRMAGDPSDLQIVVPPLDAGAMQASAAEARRRAKADPIVAYDRAARRAWWTAVIGVMGLPILWPLLLYSAAVVLGLGLLNRPLSRRGARFFYGALALNALAVAAVFTFLALRQ